MIKLVTVMGTRQEITERWKSIGFLNGIKEGSICEWRCAKSFEDCAEFLMGKSDGRLRPLEVVAFPFIRRCLTRGGKRISRFLTPEEVVGFFETTKVSDLFEFVCTEQYKRKSRYNPLLRNMAKLDVFGDMTLLDFWNAFNTGCNKYVKMLSTLSEGLMDVEGEMVMVSCSYFVEKNGK